jgi:23S rRNA (cytosine1962-C5)-methyltransferase
MSDPALSDLPHLRLHKGRLPRIRSGHPWVFSNELETVPPLEPGSLALLDGPGGEPLGTGYFNPRTLIAFRWLSRGSDPLPDDWLESRLAASARAREFLYPGEECVRLVFGEADGLPGLVVDRYGDALAVQVLTAGMERLRPRVEAALRDLFHPRLLARRDDTSVRELEGLTRGASLDPPEAEPSEVRYLGLTFRPDFREGQKTGLFLDQRGNVEAFLRHLPAGASVLDLFCYLGAWGMAALKAGAASAEFADASAKACAAVEEGLKANGLPECDLHCGDAFDVLSALRREGKRYSAVVCDPPAFAKSRKHLPEAVKAYRRLNGMALSLVEPGGLLVSCSCSHHVGREEFREILREACASSGRTAQLLEFRGPSADHPILLNFPEGDYLKCAILRVQ